MPAFVIRYAALSAVLFLANAAVGADPDEPEKTPAPRQVAPPAVVEFPAYVRQNRYDVWQLYAVDRQGTFRPRVILAPSGPYYLYNGAPYLYAITRPLDISPSAGGVQYRAAPAVMPYCSED